MGCFGGMCFLPQGSRRADRWSERSAEAGEPTGAREQVCGPDVILTTGVKGAREDARVKIMSVGCPQTAGRASRSGVGLAIGRHGDSRPKPKHAPPRPRKGAYFTSSIAILPAMRRPFKRRPSESARFSNETSRQDSGQPLKNSTLPFTSCAIISRTAVAAAH